MLLLPLLTGLDMLIIDKCERGGFVLVEKESPRRMMLRRLLRAAGGSTIQAMHKK